ncbi:MAG TPA: TadE/TadG family type IV pilus assembly protein [Candidatus Cybelea sp.]|nr:TadE/TadG family type IV pilus assembly protein [Candidatus Cybelea sp.]
MSRTWRCDRGTSLIEFAIAAPMIVFLLIGLIEIGRYTYFAILAASAARAGAQYGAQDLLTAYDQSGIESAASADGENLPNWTVTVNELCASAGSAPAQCNTPWGSSPPAGITYYVDVGVTGTFTTLMNYPGIPNNIAISGSSTMRVATQ